MISLRSALGACVLALAPYSATAADHIFPTDIVGSGEVDATVRWSTFTIEEPLSSSNFSIKEERDEEDLSLRTGLGHGWHVGASVPYYSKDKITGESTTGSLPIADRKGWRNVDLWASVRLLDGQGSTPTVRGTVQFDTNSGAAGNEGFEAAVTAGYPDRLGWRPYATLAVGVRTESRFHDFQGANLGAFYAISDRITLNPAAFIRHLSATNTAGTNVEYGFSTTAQVRAGNDSFLIPGVGYEHLGPLAAGLLSYGSANTWIYSLAWYSLFGAHSR